MGADFEVTFIDKDADEGDVFRIHRGAFVDTYTRERAGQRVLRLKTVNAPPIEYAEPAVRAFRELADHWGAPIVFVIDPDVRKPPAAQFLYEWSRRAFHDGSVDRSFMVMGNRVTKALGRLVCRMFVAGGMPIEAVTERELQERLSRLDLSCGRPGFATRPETTALVVRRGFGDTAYGQLFVRAFRRFTGGRGEAARP